jgi:hypothetical protein
MTHPPTFRDERTDAVENASYRWGYLVLSFGLLATTAWRSFVRGESAWDLLALVVLGGIVAGVYQGREMVLSRRWVMLAVLAMAVAALAASLLLRT